MLRGFTHPDQPGPARAAEKIDQKCLDHVIRVMSEKNNRATAPPRYVGKKPISRDASRGLDRTLVLAGQFADVGFADFTIEFEIAR